MSNLKNNAAYDLSLFESRKASIVEIVPNKKLENQIRKAGAAKNLINTIAILFMSIFVVTFFGLNITSRVNLTEMDTETMTHVKQLEILKSENTRLTDELVRETSNKNVEKYAREELNMEKVQSHQIEYYTVNEEDKIIMPEKEISFFDKIAAKIKRLFS